MNPIRSITCLFLILGILLIFPAVSGQERENREQEEKQEMEKELQAEKEKLQKEMLEQQKRMQIMENEFRKRAREYERMSREASGSSSVYVTAPKSGNAYIVGSPMQDSRSQLTLRKTFQGNTESSEGEFEVDAGIRHFKCMINGSVRSGEIHIRVEYPGGEEFKELMINSSADISFSQSVSFNEEEEGDKYTGTWTYRINAEDAEGHYMLQIVTN